ncbi:DUF4352 domain-containing protein [Enterococcus entomosocium]|uniref:DUF4352 domain-containing protein n=1 Tax=Enterococcus entomosocium TaxID=3034352 RepID=UPI003BC5C51C
MKIKKKLLMLIGISFALFHISACSINDKSNIVSKSRNGSSEQVAGHPESIISGLKIKIDKQEINQKKTKDGDHELYTFTITGENMGSVAAGLGSIDFLLETEDGKLLELDHTMAMFGNEIAVGETITGQVSFALEEGQVAKKLIYKPGEEQLAEWDVKSE